MRKLCAALAFALFAAGIAAADGLLYRLPADGAMARYDMEMTVAKDGKQLTGKGTAILSSVGRKEVDGKPCRWIEIIFEVKIEDREEKSITKVLIPEKHLKEGEEPLKHVMKAWQQDRDNARELAVDRLADSPLPVFLAPALKDAKKLPKALIDTKLGKLE